MPDLAIPHTHHAVSSFEERKTLCGKELLTETLCAGLLATDWDSYNLSTRVCPICDQLVTVEVIKNV